jgi:hypothetical protein
VVGGRHANGQLRFGNAQCYSLSDKYFGRSRPALAWFCQTKVGRLLFLKVYMLPPILEIQFVKKIGFL